MLLTLDCRYGSLKTGDCQNVVSGSLKVQIKAVWIRGELLLSTSIHCLYTDQKLDKGTLGHRKVEE